MKKLFSGLLAGLFLAASAGVASAAAIYVPPFTGHEKVLKDGAAYLSGGVGINERAQMKHLVKNYAVKLIFDVDSGSYPGAYLSAVRVKIQKAGGRVLLDAVSNGPWFFAKLPAGRYLVTAVFNGRKHVQGITVAPHQQVHRVILSWKA
jgi:hypothetical protein